MISDSPDGVHSVAYSAWIWLSESRWDQGGRCPLVRFKCRLPDWAFSGCVGKRPLKAAGENVEHMAVTKKNEHRDRPQADSGPSTGTPVRKSVWRWALLALIAVIAISAAIHLYPRSRSYSGPVQHVIVISLDTSRADHFGCYGNTWIQTPNLDALAKESILFSDYITVVTTTLASHVSLFTGKYPHTHGVPRNGFMVNGDNVMLAEILHDAGFHTAGFLGSFALDSRFDFAQGFDHYDENFDVLVGAGGVDQNQRRAAAVTDAAIEYLDAHELPDHLFLFVHYFDPHTPYAPPPPYDAMYGDASRPAPVWVKNHPALALGKRPDDVKRKIFRYAGEVSYMDEHLGRLLDDLRRRGILDNALLVVTSDHGENLTDAPGAAFDHGWTVQRVETHCVCTVRLPAGAQGGTKYEPLTASIDLLPTITKYLDLPTPADVEGEALDLLNLVPPSTPRICYSEATKPWGQIEIGQPWYNLRKPRCVRREMLKYIQAQYRSEQALYDLAADPRERTNLLADPAGPGSALAAPLRDLLRRWAASANPLPSRFEPSQRMDTFRRLRSLGYLGGDDEEPEKADEDGD